MYVRMCIQLSVFVLSCLYFGPMALQYWINQSIYVKIKSIAMMYKYIFLHQITARRPRYTLTHWNIML